MSLFFLMYVVLLTYFTHPQTKPPSVSSAWMPKRHLTGWSWTICSWSYKNLVLDQHLFFWIKLLYTSPSASIPTNLINSQPLKLQHSTRQGCPLSPLRFDLATEPLAITLRNCNHLHGIWRGNNIKFRFTQTICYCTSLIQIPPYQLHSLCSTSLVKLLVIN